MMGKEARIAYRSGEPPSFRWIGYYGKKLRHRV